MALPVYSQLLYPMISVYTDLNRYNNGSQQGIQILNDPPFNINNSERYIFGTVTGINYLGTRVSLGQEVMIDRGQAILVTQGGITYYLADENTVLMTENPIIP